MSNHPNHRRGHDRRTETGPRWENRNPGKGSNATHVARARAKWKKRTRRAERRARGEEAMSEKTQAEDPIANDRPMQVGKWEFRAHVQTRPQERNQTGSWSKEPPLEKGDLWYKIVLDVANNDDSGEVGMWGELETCWHWTVEEALSQAKTIPSMHVVWTEYDEKEDVYTTRTALAEFGELFERAVKRFRLVAPEIA